jgi:response regulator of citrate/malate metabolism
VRTAVRRGAAGYLVKPFTFATLRAGLLRYATFRRNATSREKAVDQRDVDEAIAVLRTATPGPVPKTLSPESLDAVRATLLAGSEPLTAAEVAERTGMARVTARRYLDHLTQTGVCSREPEYGRAGRPLLRYRVLAAGRAGNEQRSTVR